MLRLAIIVAALHSALAAHAEPLHVPGQYPTIQSAIDAAQPGDEIHIAPGTYRELLNPENKSLTLIGAGPDQTILSGDLDGDTAPDGPILHYANELADVFPFVTLRGLTIENATRGLKINRAADIDVESCEFRACGRGIDLSGTLLFDPYAFNITIKKSLFVGPGGGVQVQSALAFNVHESSFVNLTEASILAAGLNGTEDVAHVSLSMCNFTGVQSGSSWINSAVVEINDCNITECHDAPLMVDSPSVRVIRCTFERNSGGDALAGTGKASAILIQTNGDADILDCAFLGNNTNGASSASALLVTAFTSQHEAVVSKCTFDSNVGLAKSAVEAVNVRFEDCLFSRNVSRGVGPINFGGSGTVVRCEFIANGQVQPDGSYWPMGGGGLCLESETLVIKDSLFQNNIASSAGAIMNRGVIAVSSCRFEGNRAELEAGAISNNSGFSAVTNSVFIGNTAQAGSGGVVWTHRLFTLSNNTFIGNTAKHGTVVYSLRGNALSPVTQVAGITSNIVVHDDQSVPAFESLRGLIAVSESSNLITTNPNAPRFTRPPSHGGDGFGDDPRTPLIDESLNDDFGDLTLLPGSPAIDAGGNAKLPRDVNDLDRDGDTDELLVGSADLDGNARFVDDPNTPNAHDPAGLTGPIDLGPYEFQSPALTLPCPADTNADGILSPADFSAWVAAFNAMLPACDQNADALCTPADFSAWVASYNAGC